MSRQQAQARLLEWWRDQGSRISPDFATWSAKQLRDDLWVLAPPGRPTTIYIVTGAEVRAVHPARESVKDVLAGFGVRG